MKGKESDNAKMTSFSFTFWLKFISNDNQPNYQFPMNFFLSDSLSILLNTLEQSRYLQFHYKYKKEKSIMFLIFTNSFWHLIYITVNRRFN